MDKTPDELTQLAFNLKEGEPLTAQHQAICVEWESGKGEKEMNETIGLAKLLIEMGALDVGYLDAKKEEIRLQANWQK